MLHRTRAAAADHEIVLVVLEQHPDDRRLRHEGVHPVRNAAGAGTAQKIAGKAGSVVVVHGEEAVLHGLRGQRSGVNGEVSALGMAARAQRAGTAHGGVLQIREGVLLGGHFYVCGNAMKTGG